MVSVLVVENAGGGHRCRVVPSNSVPQPVVSENRGSLSVGWLLNLECAHSAVATLEAEMKVARALDLAAVWRIVDRHCQVRRPSFRSWHMVS
jgi:hypothetical protein